MRGHVEAGPKRTPDASMTYEQESLPESQGPVDHEPVRREAWLVEEMGRMPSLHFSGWLAFERLGQATRPHLSEDRPTGGLRVLYDDLTLQRTNIGSGLTAAREATKQAPLGLLKPLPIPERPGESLSMDFMDTLITSKSGMRHIFVIVDRFSKYARLVAMPETTRTEYMIRMFKENLVRDFGLPKSIISDRDVRFTSELWKVAAAKQGTQLQMTSGNHPEANGQAEQLNRIVQHLLRHYIKPNQVDWDKKLALIASLYNNAVHSATGITLREGFEFVDPERDSGTTEVRIVMAGTFTLPNETVRMRLSPFMLGRMRGVDRVEQAVVVLPRLNFEDAMVHREYYRAFLNMGPFEEEHGYEMLCVLRAVVLTRPRIPLVSDETMWGVIRREVGEGLEAGKEGQGSGAADEIGGSEGGLREMVSSLTRALNKNQEYMADAKKKLTFNGANITKFLIDYENLVTLLRWSEEKKMDHLRQHVSLNLGRDTMTIVVTSRSWKEVRDVMMRRYMASEKMATKLELAVVQRKFFAKYNDFLREFTLMALRIPGVTDRIMSKYFLRQFIKFDQDKILSTYQQTTNFMNTRDVDFNTVTDIAEKMVVTDSLALLKEGEVINLTGKTEDKASPKLLKGLRQLLTRRRVEIDEGPEQQEEEKEEEAPREVANLQRIPRDLEDLEKVFSNIRLSLLDHEDGEVMRVPPGTKLSFHARPLAERRYSQLKKEVLVVLHCLKTFQAYLFGRRFILRIDPTNVVGELKNYKPIDPTVGRWVGFIWQFDCKIEHIADLRNRADGLSRVCITPERVEDAEHVDAFLHYEGGTLVVDNEMVEPACTSGELLLYALEKESPTVVAELREGAELQGPIVSKRRTHGVTLWGFRKS
ncbi:hypothetical protein CBR_g3410 [Chara braunii]|uniref:Integrase catalytic domain-containing protein n=1 Tax=Chara braunii TaxID=69332 RepID=A0A388JQS1_CHABU|nr:hypothetical protein CBR_g3410 [Chara braunii]|eukprot:GBG60166.1 hypothetical protein CBR_g3410 [Chara braunii]